jgi:hypothetical protein
MEAILKSGESQQSIEIEASFQQPALLGEDEARSLLA